MKHEAAGASKSCDKTEGFSICANILTGSIMHK